MTARGGLSSWTSIGILSVVIGGAAVLSVYTAPAHKAAISSASTTTLATLPSTTLGLGTSCSPPSGSATITLSDMSPRPTVTVPVGELLVVMVPSWGWGDATDVSIGNSTALSEQCSVLLPDHGRRTILLVLAAGQSTLSATVTPPSDAAMPAWLGTVVVTG